MKFYCDKYPNITITALKVTFVNGVYETNDKKVTELLKNFEYVTYDEIEEVVEEKPKTTRRRKTTTTTTKTE